MLQKGGGGVQKVRIYVTLRIIKARPQSTFGIFSNYVLKIKIHREFRLHLREDPSSIFAPDIEIENTLGPVNYDISRIYSGVIEGTVLFIYYFF